MSGPSRTTQEVGRHEGRKSARSRQSVVDHVHRPRNRSAQDRRRRCARARDWSAPCRYGCAPGWDTARGEATHGPVSREPSSHHASTATSAADGSDMAHRRAHARGNPRRTRSPKRYRVETSSSASTEESPEGPGSVDLVKDRGTARFHCARIATTLQLVHRQSHRHASGSRPPDPGQCPVPPVIGPRRELSNLHRGQFSPGRWRRHIALSSSVLHACMYSRTIE